MIYEFWHEGEENDATWVYDTKKDANGLDRIRRATPEERAAILASRGHGGNGPSVITPWSVAKEKKRPFAAAKWPDDNRLASLAKKVRYQWDKQGRLKEVWTAALNEEDREALRFLGIDPS